MGGRDTANRSVPLTSAITSKTIEAMLAPMRIETNGLSRFIGK
jgi:hypothetical protein